MDYYLLPNMILVLIHSWQQLYIYLLIQINLLLVFSKISSFTSATCLIISIEYMFYSKK